MYTVFGYNMNMVDFEKKFDSFVAAVSFYLAYRNVYVLFLRREQPGTCRYMWRW